MTGQDREKDDAGSPPLQHIWVKDSLFLCDFFAFCKEVTENRKYRC
jgi:hypothetical protein